MIAGTFWDPSQFSIWDIAHQNMKLDNLGIDVKNKVKVINFGLCKTGGVGTQLDTLDWPHWPPSCQMFRVHEENLWSVETFPLQMSPITNFSIRMTGNNTFCSHNGCTTPRNSYTTAQRRTTVAQRHTTVAQRRTTIARILKKSKLSILHVL